MGIELLPQRSNSKSEKKMSRILNVCKAIAAAEILYCITQARTAAARYYFKNPFIDS